MDLAPQRVGDVQVEAQRRRGRVRHRLRVEDGEDGLERRGGLDAHARSSAKNSAIAPSTPLPPVIPSQRDLIMPTSRYAWSVGTIA